MHPLPLFRIALIYVAQIVRLHHAGKIQKCCLQNVLHLSHRLCYLIQFEILSWSIVHLSPLSYCRLCHHSSFHYTYHIAID